MGEVDAFEFQISNLCTSEQKKYLKYQVYDTNEFVRAKNAEVMWQKLSQAFNKGNCTPEQLFAEIHQMRQSVIVHGIPMTVRPSAYLLLLGISENQVLEQKAAYDLLVRNFFALPDSHALRKDIKQVKPKTNCVVTNCNSLPIRI